MRMISEHKKIIAVLVVLLMGVFVCTLTAGNLNPHGPPDSTMKTLDEIEPATPISSVPYIISEPGSYYLSTNAQATSSLFSGITIWADHVTLDLKGFSLVGDGTPGRHGISIEGTHKNITIRNGTITNWGGNGIEAPDTNNCRVEDLQVIDNKISGIHLPGDGQLVTNCVASGNGTSASIAIYGIYVGTGSTVTGNIAYDNGGLAASYVYGIRASSGSTVTGNTSYSNGTSATGNTVDGIHASAGCTVSGNTSHDNGNDAHNSVNGIYLDWGCTVTGNTVYDNGDNAGETVYGLRLGSHCLVDQNMVLGNGAGAASSISMDKNVLGCVYGNNVAAQ